MLKPFLLGVVLLISLAIHGQRSKVNGVVLSFGMGHGTANGLCTAGGEAERIGGYTVLAEAGYRINHAFAVTFGPGSWVEGNGMFDDETFSNKKPDNAREHFMLYGYYYPVKKLDGFVKLGAGFGNYFYTSYQPIPIDEGRSTTSSIVNTGFEWSATVGYDIRVGRRFSIRPDFNIYHTTVGDLKFTTGETLQNTKPSIVKNFTISFVLGPMPFNEP